VIYGKVPVTYEVKVTWEVSWTKQNQRVSLVPYN